ncbi:unnamed protein product [Prorocentrum cordatum]|uniref:Uncharacterized protein n=1 Tax=Prorocentrum cordatum TaxID=2364126 RepID=A0ABN9YIQ6_9DINO|nr:unnamed protein product [Polarella glacialis]
MEPPSRAPAAKAPTTRAPISRRFCCKKSRYSSAASEKENGDSMFHFRAAAQPQMLIKPLPKNPTLLDASTASVAYGESPPRAMVRGTRAEDLRGLPHEEHGEERAEGLPDCLLLNGYHAPGCAQRGTRARGAAS